MSTVELVAWPIDIDVKGILESNRTDIINLVLLPACVGPIVRVLTEIEPDMGSVDISELLSGNSVFDLDKINEHRVVYANSKLPNMNFLPVFCHFSQSTIDELALSLLDKCVMAYERN